ncbi:hypothetical protein GGQ85_004043 [Nitrobacter vulgaris]|nr:hypothetical protein [Nitrobacter vulgaris]
MLPVAELVALSRATLANIWQNITLALGLKSVFLVTTLFGATPLWMAILADTGATVLVTTNALRLLRFEFKACAGPWQFDYVVGAAAALRTAEASNEWYVRQSAVIGLRRSGCPVSASHSDPAHGAGLQVCFGVE